MAVRISNVSVLSICRHITTIANLLREFSYLEWVGYYVGIMRDEIEHPIEGPFPIEAREWGTAQSVLKQNGNWYWHKYLRPACPDCGSVNVYYRKTYDNWRCNRCGHANFDPTNTEWLDAVNEAEPELLAMAETNAKLREYLEGTVSGQMLFHGVGLEGRLPKKKWRMTKDRWQTVGIVILFFVFLSWFFYGMSGSILGAVGMFATLAVVIGVLGVFAFIDARLEKRRNYRREWSKELERRTAQKNLEKLSAEVRLLDEPIRVSEANREDDPRQK